MKITKKLALTAVAATCILSGVAQAANPGSTYFGVQLGAGKVRPSNVLNQGASNLVTSLNVDSFNRFAARAFAGYQLDNTFSLETGYTNFGNSTITKTSTPFNSVNKLSVRSYAIDLVGKASLPLQNGISVYGKAGAAYLNEKGKSSSSVLGIQTSNVSSSASAVYPTVGAGVSYDINQNVAADVSWSHIQKVGSSRKLKNTDFIGIGLTYAIA